MQSNQTIGLKKLSTNHDTTYPLWSVAITPDRKRIITAGSNKEAKVYTLANNLLTLEDTITTQHTKSIRSVAISPDGTLLALASFDSTVSVWLCSDDVFDCVSVLEGHENEVKCVDWHPERNYLATCGRDKSVWVWEYSDLYEFYCICIINAHSQDVKYVKWIPNRDLIASCSYDDTIKIWKKDETDDDDEYYNIQTIKASLLGSRIDCMDGRV